MSAPPRLALIVEDEPAIRRFLRATLFANGYEVLEAATAHAGLTLARGERPDVLILDLGLPDRDGLDLLRELRTESELPVLVLSARDSEAAKVAALDLGADDYVTKPFGADELMARLRVALRHRLRAGGDAPRYEHDGLVVDVLRRQVSLHGAPLHQRGDKPVAPIAAMGVCSCVCVCERERERHLCVRERHVCVRERGMDAGSHGCVFRACT